jgi:hypothetical protein
MKSLQQDNIIRTKCKDCVLAIYNKNTQTGCLADRINKLEHFEAYDDEKEFFVIERLCNYYRDDHEKYMINGVPYIEKIKLESQISFDLIINCDKIDEDYKNKIISFYTSTASKYNENKLRVYLLSHSINKHEKHQIFDMRKYIGNPSISFVLDSRLIHDKIMSTRNSYHIIISKNNFPSIDFIYDANSIVNEEMKKAIVIEGGKVKAISNLAYKIESSKNNIMDYDKIVHNIIISSKDMDLYQKVS